MQVSQHRRWEKTYADPDCPAFAILRRLRRDCPHLADRAGDADAANRHNRPLLVDPCSDDAHLRGVIINEPAERRPLDKPDPDARDAVLIDRFLVQAITTATTINLIGGRASLDVIVEDAMHALALQLPPELQGRAQARLLSLLEVESAPSAEGPES